MNIVLLVYLASIVNTVKAVSGMCALFILVGLVVYIYSALMLSSDLFHIKKTITAVVLLGSISILTPSEKTIYLMAGASIAQDIANSPKTAAAMEKVYKIVEKKLDSQLEELMDKAEKKIKSEEVAK